ncbi:MAG: response regulator [Candidatus Bipolaricaulia bacterium]
MEREKIEVLLADDHTLVRQGLRALLEREPGLEIVAEAGDGRRALELIEENRPLVAVLDISMPQMNGLEAARRIAKTSPETRVILLSMYKSPEYVREAVRAGVRGYILKENAAEELVEAIHKVARGGYHFAPPILEEIVASARGPSRSRLDLLTPREREVLQLIAEGHTNKEISKIIHRSPETVRSHRASIMKKLELHSIAELVRFAVAEGLVPPFPEEL